jgi:hypothetical protein
LVTIFVLAVLGVGVFLLVKDVRKSPEKPQTSNIENIEVSDNVTTFTSPYFKFRDNGKWVLDAKNSTDNKFIYTKFKGLDAVYQMIVYVNQVPIANQLATARVLPVRIVNDNSFDVTNVSDPCLKYYAPSDLHNVKTVNINEATMLCDPETPQYNVQLAQITGNYQLHLKRADGTPITFVITFHDGNLEPGPQTLLRVASSFKAL